MGTKNKTFDQKLKSIKNTNTFINNLSGLTINVVENYNKMKNKYKPVQVLNKQYFVCLNDDHTKYSIYFFNVYLIIILLCTELLQVRIIKVQYI